MEIKAIETKYKGYRFRSRLEARWAVFFDAVDIKWEYEKEGFDLGEAGWYLPDFWLPELQTWVEIKPDNSSEIKKVKALVSAQENTVVVLFGQPWRGEYHGLFLRRDKDLAPAGWHLSELLLCSCGSLASMDIDPVQGCVRIAEFRVCPERGKTHGMEYRIPINAYEKARSTRFEHGETGST